MALVIVGHGESLVGSGHGAQIDSHEVVRLKLPTWETKADHGVRCDFMCASTETMMAMLDHPRKPRQYWAQPKKGSYSKHTEARFLERASAPLHIPLDLFLLWNAKYLAQGMKHTNFSVGSAAILFALDLTAHREILLAGFDNLLNPGLLDYRKAGRGKWRSDHDWQAENTMLDALRKHYGAEIKGL